MNSRDKAIHRDRARAPVYLQTEGGSEGGSEEGQMTKGPGCLGSGPREAWPLGDLGSSAPVLA